MNLTPTPQQRDVNDAFFNSEHTKIGVTSGIGCGTTTAAIAIAIANMVEKERSTILVCKVPKAYRYKCAWMLMVSSAKASSEQLVCSGSRIYVKGKKDTFVEVIYADGFTEEYAVEIAKSGSVDVILDGLSPFLFRQDELITVLDTLAPYKTMFFDKAISMNYGYSPELPNCFAVSYGLIQNHGFHNIKLSSFDSPLCTSKCLALQKPDLWGETHEQMQARLRGEFLIEEEPECQQ